MIGYLLGIIPLYIFIYLPLSSHYFPSADVDGYSQQHGGGGGAAYVFNESFVAPEQPVTCAPHRYAAHILSRDPLVVYLEGFLSADESEHLISQATDKFTTSATSHGSETKVDPLIRDSTVATLERTQEVKCIEERARSFQGYRPRLAIERLKLQKYGVGGHYTHHYDWRGGGRMDRVSSFMVYVDAECEGGGTEFPRLERPRDARWCKWIECGGDDGDGEGTRNLTAGVGVTFRPVKGNAVYWENLRPDGSGRPETWHAGLPVESGSKIGLNIWSWYAF